MQDSPCLFLDLLGCNEGDSGGVAVLCGNDLLGGPSEDVLVPLVDGVVVELSCRGDLSLEIHILLHCISDLIVCLEVGIVLNCYVDVARHSVDLAAEGVTVNEVLAYIDNGISIADMRPIRYENGEIMVEGGRVYLTVSIRMQAECFQGVISWVPGTMHFEMTGILFFDHGDGFWRGYIASILLYNRNAKKWYVWTSSFEHAHILAYGQFDGDPRFGINVADVTIMEKAGENDPDTAFLGFFRDEDPDLIYDEENDRWLLAICRIDKKVHHYVYMFFESDDPFKNFEYIGCGYSGAETGGSFVKMNGELYFVCGNDFKKTSGFTT